MALRLVDQGLKHLPLGREPETVVHEGCIARHDLVAGAHGRAVHGQRLDGPVGGLQQRAAGSFVDAPGFHSDEPVLHQVKPADPVCPPQFVEPFEESGGGKARPVNRNWIAFLEVDVHVQGSIRSRFRCNRPLKHRLVRFAPRVLERLALVGGVQQVRIGGIGGLAGARVVDRDLVRLRVREQVGSGL